MTKYQSVWEYYRFLKATFDLLQGVVMALKPAILLYHLHRVLPQTVAVMTEMSIEVIVRERYVSPVAPAVTG